MGDINKTHNHRQASEISEEEKVDRNSEEALKVHD